MIRFINFLYGFSVATVRRIDSIFSDSFPFSSVSSHSQFSHICRIPLRMHYFLSGSFVDQVEIPIFSMQLFLIFTNASAAIKRFMQYSELAKLFSYAAIELFNWFTLFGRMRAHRMHTQKNRIFFCVWLYTDKTIYRACKSELQVFHIHSQCTWLTNRNTRLKHIEANKRQPGTKTNTNCNSNADKILPYNPNTKLNSVFMTV